MTEIPAPTPEEYAERVLPKPKIKEGRRGELAFRWEREGIDGVVTNLEQAKSGEVSCFIRFKSDTFGTVLPRRHLNLTADRTVTSLVNTLNRRTSEAFQWERIMDHVSEMCDLKLTQGKPATWIGYDPNVEAPEAIIAPFIHANEATILSADGGTGKTTFANAVLLTYSTGAPVVPGLTVPEPAPALFLDWEGNPSVHRFLTTRLLAGVGERTTEALLYMQCRGRLIEQVDHIHKTIDEYGIKLIVVDSASWACGGDAESMETVSYYERALSDIGCASLNLAHTAKHSDQNKPFGSVFWHNMARSSWQMRQLREETDSIHVALFHRKSNYHQRHAPLGYRINFSNNTITFTQENVSEHFDKDLELHQRIKLYLLNEPNQTARDVAEDLNESQAAVANCLRRGEGKSFIRTGEQRPFPWAVMADEQSDLRVNKHKSKLDSQAPLLRRGEPPVNPTDNGKKEGDLW